MDKKIIDKIVRYIEKIENDSISKDDNDAKKKLLFLNKKIYEENLKLRKEFESLLLEDFSEKENNDVKKEIKRLILEENLILEKTKNLIISQDQERFKQNVVMEIRRGTGGEESLIFVNDLFTMYQKFSEIKKWKLELVETKTDIKGNFYFVSLLIKGDGVFKFLKNESGVHRVQRIPKTENKDRTHTSTATVVVFPEPKDIILNEIPSKDLIINYYRSSGAGGQHVNTTDSAVRITHLPTKIVSTSQDGRSQHDNKQKALIILRSRIMERKILEEEEKNKNIRSVIGRAERYDKIRTYNYSQGRIKDHRTGKDYNLRIIMNNGNLENLALELIDYELENKLDKK